MTTERILPAIAGAPARRSAVPAVPAARAGTSVARPAVAHRGQPFLTMPARAGMLLGTSAAIYAVSLAAVATFQSADDRALAAGRQPFVDAVAVSRARNDELEASLAAVDVRARALAAEVGTTSADVAAYEARLDELAALVAKVRGSATALPARIKLPSVSIHGSIASGGGSHPRPTTTTRASGG